MPRKRRQPYRGCSLSPDGSKIRLRFRVVRPEGGYLRVSRATGLDWTPENIRRLAPTAELIGALLDRGAPLAEIDDALGRAPVVAPTAGDAPAEPGSVTVAELFERWIEHREVVARPEQARKDRQHFRGFILPAFEAMPVADLTAADVRGLQAQILAKYSPKYAKNILSSLRAMMRVAIADALVSRDLFAGMEWPDDYETPEPSPLTSQQRAKVVAWFRKLKLGFHPGRGKKDIQWREHPPFAAYVFTLFWTGLRPSEASGLQNRDLNLERGLLYVRRSRHGYTTGKPKTKKARRTVELFPAVVAELRAIVDPEGAPEAHVFLNTKGRPIEPDKFNRDHWTRCLEALKIPHRGLYSTKDTFVTTAMMLACPPAWLEEQTGVKWDTLREHYAKWLHGEGESPLVRFAAVDATLFAGGKTARKPKRATGPNRVTTRIPDASGMEAGGIERPAASEIACSSNALNPQKKGPKRAQRPGPVHLRERNGTDD